MLLLDSLPPATARLFQHFSSQSLLAGFVLIGGTALALQIGHRHSEDLDFWLPAPHLDKVVIGTIVAQARAAGFAVTAATPQHLITAERINRGRDLLSLAQDYAIGGVKVTFFARDDAQYRRFGACARLHVPGLSFTLMGEDGLFAMKAALLHQRRRARDLFDLHALLQRGRTLEDILRVGLEASPAYGEEHAKAVLMGDLPLDTNDEGLAPIGENPSVDALHAYFRTAVDEYEQQAAARLLAARRG